MKKCIKSDFKEISLKPATNGWSYKAFLLTSQLCPVGGCPPLPRGYIHVPNHETNCIKSDFKDMFFLNLQPMNDVTRHFCWHQNFVPWGWGCLSQPRGYMHVKNPKKMYKIRLKRVFLNLQQMTKVTRCSCWHENFVPKGLSAPALGLYTCITSWKNCIKSDFKEIFETCSKCFCWHQNFVPWGCLPLTCGYIHL